jgi:hypothetical protein
LRQDEPVIAAALHVPTLSDMLTVLGAGGVVAGGIIGFLFKAESDRRIAENVALGGGVGLVAGFLVAFVLYGSARVAGA